MSLALEGGGGGVRCSNASLSVAGWSQASAVVLISFCVRRTVRPFASLRTAVIGVYRGV